MAEKPLHLTLTWGGNLKSVSDQGVLEGKAIVFGSELEPDISPFKDFFTEDTYVHPDEAFTTPLFFEHGLSYRKPIGKALVYKTANGWDATAELDLTDPVVKARFPEIKAGGWGFSSGAVGHVVDRHKKSNGTHHIVQWAVGELSITKTPAEPKALIHSVKSLDELYNPNNMTEETKDLESSTKTTDDLIEIIKMLITETTKKHTEELVIPQIEVFKSAIEAGVNEIKESLRLSPNGNEPEGDTNEKLTVLKSENEELTSKLSELQSSFDEKLEALLSEKMALLSEEKQANTDEVVEVEETETKSEDVKTLEEALEASQAEVDALNKKIETLSKANLALAKTNFNL